jgi:hypothetical protein
MLARRPAEPMNSLRKPMLHAEPVDHSETVLLGCLVGEHLRLWRADGRAECVRLREPADLQALLARGRAPRMPFGTQRFREIGRLEGSVLLIGERSFEIEVCDEPPASDALWDAAAEMFQAAAVAAIARGEFLVVEPGGTQGKAEHYALAGASRTPGEWLLRVEAVPAPRAPSWPEPPEGQFGWGVAAPAEPAALAALGSLLADAVSMWATSPFDVTFTYGTQPDGPWPPAEVPAGVVEFLDDIRADIEALHETRTLPRARELSARTGVALNHSTYPVYFTGPLDSPVVLVHHNPVQRAVDAEQYAGGFEFADVDDYVEQHVRSGHYRWEVGEQQPSPGDFKQMRFLRHWGVGGHADGTTPAEQRSNVACAVDERLLLELIPYGSPKFPAAPLPADVVGPLYERLMRVITAYPRNFVVLCGPVLEPILSSSIVAREEHRFRLPTSTGVSRSEYAFCNLLLDFGGEHVAVGLAPHYASPGVPMDAYGAACRARYRAEGPVRSAR